MTPREVALDLRPRLEKAAADVEDARKQLDVALTRRDTLVVQARTEGMSQKAIATAAKISQPHVVRLLAAAQPGLALPA